MIDESTRTYLKSKLPEYLRAHGIDPSRSFTCLNPQHRDLGQSMHYNPQTQTLDCPQCQTRYDIFDLVCLEHNLPSLAAAVNYLYDQYLGAEQMPEVAPQAERPSAPAVKTHNVSDFDLDLDNINSPSYLKLSPHWILGSRPCLQPRTLIWALPRYRRKRRKLLARWAVLTLLAQCKLLALRPVLPPRKHL